MTDKIGIFYFSSIPYNFIKQRPQQLYDEWKKYFNEYYEFFYIEPIGLLSYFKRKIFKEVMEPKTDSNILSIPISRKMEDFYLSKLLMDIFMKRFLKKFDTFEKKIAILCTPLWEPLISKKEFDIISYDYLDSIKVHSNDKNYNKTELNHTNLVLKSDIIFTTAKKLEENILSISPQKEIINVSNGVTPDFFEKMKDNEVTDYKKEDKKVVGYVGAIFNWFDINLVYKSAKFLPNVDFILVGPINNQNSRVKAPKNVFLLGKKAYKQIPAYINLFDVAIIPFKDGNISESTDPIKVYEYFSLGKPVVSTYFKELEKFNDGNILKMTTTENEFNTAINYFLSEDNEIYQNERKKIAYENSWSNKADLMLDTIKNKLK